MKRRNKKDPNPMKPAATKGKTGRLPDPTKSFKSGQRAGSPMVASRKKSST